MKKKVLFNCIHNSARSQMAEAWLNNVCGETFEAESAGLEAARLEQTRLVRDAIKAKIERWCEEVCSLGASISSIP